jgi:hypothetical protein
MSQNVSEESLIRNYLLGELAEKEQDLVQERLLMDHEFLEESRIIEDELLDDYARGLLSHDDQAKLELLISPKQYRSVQLTRTLEQFLLKSDTPAPGYEELNESLGIQDGGLRQLFDEETVARKYVAARYQTLIDRQYEQGLSPSENEELGGLKVALDEMDEPYYDAIIKRLCRLVEERGV